MTDYHRGRLVRLRASLSEQVAEYAERTGRPVVEVVDQALRDYLDRQDEKETRR